MSTKLVEDGCGQEWISKCGPKSISGDSLKGINGCHLERINGCSQQMWSKDIGGCSLVDISG